jgi:hypothetical protein
MRSELGQTDRALLLMISPIGHWPRRLNYSRRQLFANAVLAASASPAKHRDRDFTLTE